MFLFFASLKLNTFDLLKTNVSPWREPIKVLLTIFDVHDLGAFVLIQCQIKNERIKANNNSTEIKKNV